MRFRAQRLTWWASVGVALLVAGAALLYQPARGASAARTFYVSRSGSNADGLSWGTAWNELSRINWAVVQPGDTLLIDGGLTACPALGPGYNCGMTYNTTLTIGKSGTSSAPITVRLASEGGRNGAAIIDGGITDWTSCAEYTAEPTPPSTGNGTAVRETGIAVGNMQWVVIDGTKWGGIEVRNHKRYGLSLGGSQHVTARYLKLHHNTDPADTTNSSVGITQGWQSQYNTVSRVEIFRNGQDAVRGAGDYFTLEESYLHDTYCNHPDGIQSFVPTSNGDVPDNEGEVRGLTVRRNVFDKIGMQNIFLGENATHNSWNVDVTIHDNLFLNSDYVIKSKHGSSRNWNVYNNTVVNAQEFAVEWCCASPGAQAPMVVRDNIFMNVKNGNTAFYMPTGGGTTTFAGNCLYQTGARNGNITESGTVTGDPRFVNSSLGNFALATGSACAGKGSSITSVSALVALSGAPLPTQPAQPTTTHTTVAPTATRTNVPATSTTAAPTATRTTAPATNTTAAATTTSTTVAPTATKTNAPSTATTTNMPAVTATHTSVPPSTATNVPATATNLPPATATTAPPDGTTVLSFAPAADAYVDASSAGSNFGDSQIVRTYASPEQRSYLRFVVQGVTGRTINRALLRVYANGSSPAGFQLYAVPSAGWSEGGLNFNNRPALGQLLGASGAHNHAVWLTIDVTGYITGSGGYSLAMVTGSTKAVGYPSRESAANQPQLILEVTGEPAVLSQVVYMPMVAGGAP